MDVRFLSRSESFLNETRKYDWWVDMKYVRTPVFLPFLCNESRGCSFPSKNNCVFSSFTIYTTIYFRRWLFAHREIHTTFKAWQQETKAKPQLFFDLVKSAFRLLDFFQKVEFVIMNSSNITSNEYLKSTFA